MFNRSKQKGFTLIEAVVSTGVFAFVVASSFGVYLSVVRLDAKSRTERSVQQNARFIMDYFSKELRNGSIDYDRTNNITTLSFTNQLDEETTIQWDATNQDLKLIKQQGTTNLNSTDVNVKDVKFVVRPSINPFVLANNVHIQPHVIIVLTLESANTKYPEITTMSIQSTFSVRDYPSRL
jgi:type II secretory pathway pseudopilin PulG